MREIHAKGRSPCWLRDWTLILGEIGSIGHAVDLEIIIGGKRWFPTFVNPINPEANWISFKIRNRWKFLRLVMLGWLWSFNNWSCDYWWTWGEYILKSFRKPCFLMRQTRFSVLQGWCWFFFQFLLQKTVVKFKLNLGLIF